MHWKRFCLVSLSLAWMAFPARVRAQEIAPAPGYSAVDNLSGAMTLTPGGGTYLLFNKQTGQAVGIPTGYSRIGVRHTLFEDGPQQVFGEAHALITDTNRYGFNAGVGYRMMLDEALWGINGWYDTIESAESYSYQQAGMGIEYLSDALDLRANGYVPFGKQENFLRVTDTGTTPVFVGHDFSTLGQALFQQALTGFDAEAGIPLPVIHWMRAYAGLYHLNFDHDETWGVRSRIEGRITQGVNLSFQVTNDDKFGTNLNIGVDVRFDGRLPTRFGAPDDAYARRYDQVRRQWQVQLAHNKGDYAVPLNDRVTGEQIVVSWIDNTAAAGGNGTIERPYNVLPSHVNSDYVMVQRGVGATVGNISLIDGQSLFGEGKQHYIDTDRLGNVAVPDAYFDNTGTLPTLLAGNPAAPVITLADDNTVRGFNILGGSTAAIAGNGTNNFLIECVNGTSASGIDIVDASGLGVIRESTFVNTSPTGVGVSVTNGTGTALNLIMNDVSTEGGAVGANVQAVGSPVNVSMTRFTGRDHTDAGVVIGAAGAAGVVNANLNNVAVTNVGDGIRLDVASGGSLSGSMTQVTATGSGNLLEGNVNTGALNLDVEGATLSGSTGGSGVSLNLANATGRAVFDNLTADGNAVDGVQTIAFGAATVYNVEVHDSSLVGNLDDAFDATVVGGASLTTLVDPTPATGSGDNGLEFDVRGTNSRLSTTFADADVSGSGNDGVNGLVLNGGQANVRFERSPATGSGRNGLNVVVDNGSSLTGAFVDGSFSQSGVGNNGVGINAQVTGNSTATLVFDNTAASNNGDKGLAYTVNGGSDLVVSFTDSDLSNNPTNNVVGSVSGAGSTAALIFNNSDANSQAVGGGFVANVTDGAVLTSTWNNSDVSNTLGDGIRVAGTGAGTQVGLTFNTSLIDGNAGNGVVASLTGGDSISRLEVVLNNSSVTGNALDGLHMTVDGTDTTGVVDINRTPITGNGLDGFEYDVTGGTNFATSITGTGNNFSDNGENGIDGFVAGAGSIANVVVDGVGANNSGDSGVQLSSEQNGRHNFTMSNSGVVENGSHGIEALASTNGRLNLNLTNVNIQRNAENGLRIDALTDGDVAGTVQGGFVRRNGQTVPASGVLANANGAGSSVRMTFDAVQNIQNTLNGFEFNSSNGALLTASMQSGTDGTLQSIGNIGDGIVLTANGTGSRANLLMFGSSTVDGNGGDGLRVEGLNAQQVAVQFSGSSNNNGGDGVHVSLGNVTQAAIEVASPNSGTIEGNAGDGIQIDLVDTDLTDLTVDGTLVESLRLEGLIIQGNGGIGININADNSDLGTGVISNNTIRENAGGGLSLNLTNGSEWNLDITDNSILDNGGTGILVAADSGNNTINISDNTVAGSLVDNIRVDLSGTTDTLLNIDRNIVDGDGIDPSITPTIVQSIQSPVDSALTSGEPPDAMGAVGTNHIIELVNDNYRVYDKATGALLISMSDEQFWRSTAGANLLGSDVFDHRIIFDPTTNRWIASTITRGGGNQIILAVSNTDDPTSGWRSVQWQGDLTGVAFNDFDTLGMDEDAVVLSTNDFGTGLTVSVFSIPKADLFGAGAPTITRMTRIQGLDPTNVGTALQAAVDFGASDGQTAILAINDNLLTGTQILRSNVLGGSASGATLSATTPITVASFNTPNNVQTPNGTSIRANSTRFWANTVEVNNELWAVHNVQGSGSLNEIRWYRIDEATNAVISTGTITAPGLSLFMPSIAVNNSGEVLISYHAASSTTAPSAYASAGIIQGSNVTFGTPTLLTAGTGEYGGGRWGDYSATVVDPTDNSRFWSILEVGRGTTDGLTDFEYGEAMNAVVITVVPGSTQTTAGDGIHVTARENSIIRTGSSFNDNSVTGHGGDGIALDLSDNATLGDFTIDGNSVADNGGDGIRVTTTGGQTMVNLSISDNDDVTNNGGNGIRVELNSVAGVPNVTLDRNTVTDNSGLGVAVDGVDTTLGVISAQGNTITGNTGGDGLRVNLSSSTGTNVIENILANNNTVGANAGNGIFISVQDMNVNDVIASSNTIDGNTAGAGLSILLDNTTAGAITAHDLVMANNLIRNNSGTGIDVLLNNITNVNRVSVSDSTVLSNGGEGYHLDSRNSTIDLIESLDSNYGESAGGDGAWFELVDTTVNTLMLDGGGAGNNTGNGVNLDLTNTQIGAASIINMNSGGVAGGNIGLRFFLDGFTISAGYEIANLSDPGVDVTAFHMDISTSGALWDTVEPGASAPFQPRIATGQAISSDIITGLQTVNGSLITPGTDPIQDNLGTPLLGGGVADNTSILDLTFNDFDATETFNWGMDIDFIGQPGSGVSGADLIGSLVHVDFTGGLFLDGLLQAVPGNPLASTFVATSSSPTTSPGNSSNTLNGLRVSLADSSSIGSLNIDNNVIGSNGQNGIEFLVSDSTLPTLPDHISVTGNTINGNAQTGISLVLPDTNGNSFGVDFADNTINGNQSGAGIDIQLDDNAGSNFEASFTGNTINTNAAQGVNIALSQNINATISDFSGSTVNGNGNVGLRIDATDNTQFSLTMGATGHNTFDANTDAGLGVTMNSNTQGQLIVLDSQFDNTANGANTTFGGEGVNIQLQDNAVLPNLVIGDPAPGTSSATGNAGSGVQIFVDGFSQLTNPTIQNMTINNNAGDGINIERRGLGVVDNFVINANTLDGNSGDGLDIQARAGNLTDEYTITNNTINDNNGRGIAFRVDGDADMTTDLDGNAITNNGGTGITVDSTINAVTDTPTFTGTWLGSTITGNGGHGVDINSPGHVIQIGDVSAAFPDTIISDNTLNGVLVRSVGTLDMDNVQINNNGLNGVQFQGGTGGLMSIDRAVISENTGHGVNLEMAGNTLSVTNARLASNGLDGVRVNSVAGVNSVTLDNNIMTLNGQDGLEVINNSAAGLTATITNSQFNSNTERGVAIFNRGNGQANVTLDDNQAVSNGEEGVYVVNTASADQDTRVNATAAMSSNGLLTATPDLIFAMNRNTVSANGLSSAFAATGLVMRVGTADGGLADFTNNGGFADSRAGVTATVRGNILQGNAGSDVFIESFVATAAPDASVGTWDAGTFALTQYQTDPLARLDLVYGDNVADATQATNIGAAYNNSEAIFKSRTTGQTPAGPFASATRDRNAQRLADRNVAAGGTNLDPVTPVVQADYLYSGVGESTFRVRLEPGNVFGAGTGFMLDGIPFVDTTDYNGVGTLNELFGWGTF